MGKGTGKDFAILRIAKIKSKAAMTRCLKHNLRSQPTHNANPDVKNINMKGLHTVDDCKARWKSIVGDQKIRKNAVYAHEAVVTGSPDAIKAMSPQEQREYFSDALKWLDDFHGGRQNRIHYTVHFDETTPHLHVLYAPVDKKGKLNSRSFIGGISETLSKVQTRFWEDVGAKHGLTRGVKKSRATHTALREFYAAMPALRERAEKLSHDILKSMRILSGLDLEIMTKGAKRNDLTNEIDALSSDIQSRRAEKAHLANEIDDLSSKLKGMKSMGLDDLRDFVSDLEDQLKNDARNERGVFRPGR